jgi:hypothetical protein
LDRQNLGVDQIGIAKLFPRRTRNSYQKLMQAHRPVRQAGRDEVFAMTSQQFISALTFKKTGVALALAVALGLTAGSASAFPVPMRDGGWRGVERVFGFTYTPESRGAGSCEGQKGAAILAGFTDGSRSANQGAACRY